jgi:hypothetical protein
MSGAVVGVPGTKAGLPGGDGGSATGKWTLKLRKTNMANYQCIL